MEGTPPQTGSNDGDARGRSSTPGIRFVRPGGQLRVDGLVLSDVNPQGSDWIPRLLKQLLPTTLTTVHDLVQEGEVGIDSGLRVTNEIVLPAAGVDEIAEQPHQLGAAVHQYVYHAVDMAYRRFDEDWQDRDQHGMRLEAHETAHRTLTRIGTGQGPFQAGVDALRLGPAALLATADPTPVVTLMLDGEAWIDAEPGTVERSLRALSALACGLDLRLVVSPSHEDRLRHDHPGWLARHGLTEPEDAPDHNQHSSPSDDGRATIEDAWAIAREYTEHGGRLRLLGNLETDTQRSMPELKRDPEIDLTEGTVGRYVPDLEADGLVAVDRDGRHNRVSLSQLGALLVDELLTDDYGLVHPSQSRLPVRLTPTPHVDASTVYRAESGMEGEDPGTRTAEEHLVATGDPAGDAEYVQWLGAASPQLDAWQMHDRQMAARRIDGITLTDHEIDRFEDGRVCYASIFDDDLQVIGQWGGSLPMLARFVATLLDPRLLSKILDEDRVGSEFDELLEAIDDDLIDVVQRGSQIGWFSEDELDRRNWFDRWTGQRARLLKRLAELVESTDSRKRAGLFEDLQGMLASATALYRLAGVDITFHIRMPDCGMLRDDEQRYRDFLDFLKYTVPKSTAYGVHNAYRQILEDREEKLRSRLPLEVDDQGTAEMAASWTVIGPTATAMRQDVEAALATNDEQVREAVQEGTEDAPAIEIPVAVGNSYGAIKRVIGERTERKNYREAQESEALRRFTRTLDAILGRAERGPSPLDVAELLNYLEQRTKPWESLTIRDLESGLSLLPAERLLPDERPTVSKMLSTLLSADEPLGRSEIIDRAGIAESTYDRNWRYLAALGIVEKDDDAQWRAWVDPWWADVNEHSDPRESDNHLGPDSRWDCVLWEAADYLDLDAFEDHELWTYPDPDEILAKTELSSWRALLVAYSDQLERTHLSYRGPSRVTIGRRPTGTENEQERLTETPHARSRAD